ncbi:glycosyltransferase family 2 protein [Oceanimonas baumannii]|uniref:glycosyltransferase family 2 protein n=1 Tax=Oceanimonas baumannii TaxID=129578 RepID=UPI003A8F7AE3
MKKSTPPNPDDKQIKRLTRSEFFDADWYVKNYPDVKIAGIEPAYHYLKYGGILKRDPGPDFDTQFYLDTRPGVEAKGLNPLLHLLSIKSASTPTYHYILWAASRLALRRSHSLAIDLAEKYIPEKLNYSTEILKANKAITEGDEESWLFHVNKYLDKFNVSPIVLHGSGSLLSRLSTKPLPKIEEGPLVSVIIPAWNAEKTIFSAATSILNQTWKNLELIIVDDASTDSTWSILNEISKKDKRVKILKNKINVGPYVSKNIALKHSNGEYITGHDADDWAHPQRIEKHLSEMLKNNRHLLASLTYMIRIQPNGYFGHIGKVTGFSLDGVARKASISCMFERGTLIDTLGYWDSVRFGADSEMIARAKKILGDRMAELEQIGMICLDLETSLTNHVEHGVDKVNGISPIRKEYRDSWSLWHTQELSRENAYLDLTQKERRYYANEKMRVPLEDIVLNIES